jgi:hypothetical protein
MGGVEVPGNWKSAGIGKLMSKSKRKRELAGATA